MNNKRKTCPYANVEVKTRPNVGELNGINLGNKIFRIEDWCVNVLGCSWMMAAGNPAALQFAIRTASKGSLSFDKNVVYGKIDGLGYLFDLSELCLEDITCGK